MTHPGLFVGYRKHWTIFNSKACQFSIFQHCKRLSQPQWTISAAQKAQFSKKLQIYVPLCCRFFFASMQEIRHWADGHVGIGIHSFDNGFEADDLETVNNYVENCF